MRELLQRFENKPPEIVFEWHDDQTPARGWVVINSLRGGAAGGGTRMRRGLDRREVESLAKTMEVKFAVAGPPIGGAKSGIDFDPADPRKDGVLRRWYRAVSPLLKSYYGTGGDLNVDEVHEVIPITESQGLWHPQEGVVKGHFAPGEGERIRRIGQLRRGVALPVEDARYTPEPAHRYLVADLITGWGVAESVRHYYRLWGGRLAGKRVIVQGWGNVGSAAAHYLAQQGAVVVGIVDREGGLLRPGGLDAQEVRRLFLDKRGNQLAAGELLPFDEVNRRIWSLGAEVFLPCAASRLVTREQVDAMAAAGLELIACGANVPFADREIFYGPVCEHADARVSVIPDFIANCGMARAFAYLMGEAEVSEAAIFEDASDTIARALQRCRARSPERTGIASTAFALTLQDLLGGVPGCTGPASPMGAAAAGSASRTV